MHNTHSAMAAQLHRTDADEKAMAHAQHRTPPLSAQAHIQGDHASISKDLEPAIDVAAAASYRRLPLELKHHSKHEAAAKKSAPILPSDSGDFTIPYNAYPEGGNYILTRDSRAFASPELGEIAVENLEASEVNPENGTAAAVDSMASDDWASNLLVSNRVSAGLSDPAFAGLEETAPAEVQSLIPEPVSGPHPEEGKAAADVLEDAGIIPEIIDRFTETTWFRATFGNTAVEHRKQLNEEAVKNPPKMEIKGAFVMPGNLYTVILVDADARTKEDVSNREHLHWLLINVPGPRDLNSAATYLEGGKEVEGYEAPNKRRHRYVLLLYLQREELQVDMATGRENFFTRVFTTTHNLTPVAGLCFSLI